MAFVSNSQGMEAFYVFIVDMQSVCMILLVKLYKFSLKIRIDHINELDRVPVVPRMKKNCDLDRSNRIADPKGDSSPFTEKLAQDPRFILALTISPKLGPFETFLGATQAAFFPVSASMFPNQRRAAKTSASVAVQSIIEPSFSDESIPVLYLYAILFSFPFSPVNPRPSSFLLTKTPLPPTSTVSSSFSDHHLLLVAVTFSAGTSIGNRLLHQHLIRLLN
ncbi:3-octaprenyl-4-hydroxybenzoate carboxylase [Corchorus capsularis]|uniref:3-octaprenyl-4-hydroxybenzoate carboxylase n=1 Tax=Corchorus capsularis TaxID=210143 RepID=A0A1R3JH87_COCAP|nr:3-octaprenyl-4-hydroxybenzoate carboxylase [Corchorus capsularis]